MFCYWIIPKIDVAELDQFCELSVRNGSSVCPYTLVVHCTFIIALYAVTLGQGGLYQNRNLVTAFAKQIYLLISRVCLD